MDELASLTRELVATPSHEDPAAAGNLIESWLRTETAATVERDGVGNVLARFRPGKEDGAEEPGGKGDKEKKEEKEEKEEKAGRSLALIGHHDVVPPDEQQVDDESFVVERRDGRLYGRGSADMKGALAAAMLAFRDVVADASVGPANAGPELLFASFVGEEVGGEGARHAIEAGFDPDLAVVGEGSTGYSADGVTDVAVAHKGRRASTIVARGRSSHASVPEEGANAIYRACDVVESIRSLSVPAVTVAGERVEGSLVVTEIDGGTAWNVVPDHCAVTIDERTVPGERASIDRIAESPDVEWTVDQDLPPMRCDDDAFAELVLGAARSNHPEQASGRPQHVVKPHATDAGWLAEAGTECVICGPAEPGEAHTATESASIDVLERCRAIYGDVARAHLSG